MTNSLDKIKEIVIASLEPFEDQIVNNIDNLRLTFYAIRSLQVFLVQLKEPRIAGEAINTRRSPKERIYINCT